MVAIAGLAPALAVAPVPALAQALSAAPPQAPAPDEAGAVAATTVDQVVVTADRAATPLDQVGQQVTVLTLPQIRLDQETDVADILARTPGVTVDRNGGPGQTTSLFIRGAESDQTVVLVDGVKVNDPSAVGAGYDFANLLTGDISRIEVLRGPQSTLYGSEAIGGVVNIITQDATRPLQGDAQAEGGSYGTAYVKGGLGGKDGPATWRIGAYYNSTDSVSAFDRALGGREADGFHTAGVSGRLSYDLTPDVQLDERAYYTASRAEFDGYDRPVVPPALYSSFGDDDEFGRTQQVVDYTGLNVSLLDGRLKNRLAYEYNELDRRDEEPNGLYGGKSTFDGVGRSNTLDYEGIYAIASGYDLTFGAQDEKSSFDTSDYGGPAAKANASIDSGYAQLKGVVASGLTLTGGVRYDAHSAFGDHVTGQASAAWVVQPGTILRASFGQGFKAPSLYQLYSLYGTPSLRPEEANGWDAGVEQHLFADAVVVSATYFGRTSTNLIDFVDCFSLITSQCAVQPNGFYANIDKDRAQGVELQGDWRPLRGLDLTANYTFDDDENRSAGALHLQLARRPKDTANLAATYVWPVRLSTTLAVRYADRSFDSDLTDVVLKSYTLLDIRAAYPLRGGLELYARVENLTDKRYETTYQYGTLGRAGYAGVRVSF